MLQSFKKALMCSALVIAGAAVALHAADEKKPADAKPYPLEICAFSGEKLGSMGTPEVLVYKGQEIKFCCSNCEDDFKKDPEAGLKKVMDAIAKAGPATKPADVK